MGRMWKATAAVAAAGLVLSACSGGGSEEEELEGGTLNMHIGEVRSLIPGGSGEVEGFRVIRNIYDGLVYYDAETGDPENLMAEEITSDDNQVWTIKIKEGYSFHNGEPVNAESFIRSWNRTAYGPNALPLNYFMAPIEGYGDMNPEELPEDEWEDPDTPEFEEAQADELSGLEAVDEHTLQVSLSEPFIGFPTMLGYEAFFPIAEACLADEEKCEKQPIGNGPFMFEDGYDVNTGGTAVAWDEYQGEKPNIGGVRWHVYVDGSDCWADYLTGDIDVCAPTAADYEQAINDPDLVERRIQQDNTSVLMMAYPMYEELYQDVNIRRALSAAIDREGVINVIGEDRAKPLDSWVPASILGGGQGACDYCEHDPDTAQELLKEAGGWPEGEPLKLWVDDRMDNLDVFRAVGDSISNTLDIEYEIVPMEWTEMLSSREQHTLDGPFRSGWGPDYNLNENYLEPIYGGGADMNDQGFESEEYNEAIKKANGADTLEESVELYAAAEEILAEEMPSAPIWVEQVNFFYSERVDNVIVHPIYSGTGGDAELRDIVINE
ncbi:peptide ABC transporter substrate-binding protein [Haloglycomyces albus]|uniref:peptide ABC transporter substrate-binding protein n=1 Tax=Haloglycomyces albus TaxID=526067 RepID=UPI00055722F0|nr:ABC transporter substrate-binding protein [Haloglycomyces albus]